MEKAVFIKPMGCAQNRFDAQILAAILYESGILAYDQGLFSDSTLFKYDVERSFLKGSAFLVLYQCALCSKSEENSLLAIEGAKKINPHIKVIVTGCLTAVKNEILGHPVMMFKEIADVQQSIIDYIAQQKGLAESNNTLHQFIRETGKLEAKVVHLKRGCRKYCTYCICPHLNKEKMENFHEIKRQLDYLHKIGVEKIEFGGPDIGDWVDTENNKTFEDILRLNLEEYDFDINYLEIHPVDMTDGIIELLKNKRVTREISLPIQSASDKLLKAMNRRYDGQYLRNLFTKLINQVPDILITTDIMIGFPGETQECFHATREFLEEFNKNIVRVDYYEFSARPHTPAARSDKQMLDFEAVKRRFESYSELIQKKTALH